MSLARTLTDIWDAIMDERRNPLRFAPAQTAHMLMQLLAWMWSAIFAALIGSYVAFGFSVAAHTLLIGGAFITLLVFRRVEPALETE